MSHFNMTFGSLPLTLWAKHGKRLARNGFSLLVGQAVASSARTALGALGAREGVIERTEILKSTRDRWRFVLDVFVQFYLGEINL